MTIIHRPLRLSIDVNWSKESRHTKATVSIITTKKRLLVRTYLLDLLGKTIHLPLQFYAYIIIIAI